MLIIVLFFSIIILSLTVFAVFRRRLFLYPKSEKENSLYAPKAVSLFAPTDEELKLFEQEENAKALAERRAEIRQNLIARANNSDFSVLTEAKEFGDSEIYRDLLDLLTEKNKLEASKIEDLANFVSQNNLPANEKLAQTVLESWKENPSSGFLPKMLHVSVLTNSAETYSNAIETTIEFRRQKRLEKISAIQLIEILESHYQLLTTETRTSGAGFLLKEKLASVRREVLGK